MTDGNGAPTSVSRRIEAPVDKVFEILADPRRHPGFDGSAMLREAASDAVISGVGDVFVMQMHNDEMGDYEITNHVVEYELNHRIGWEPALSGASRPEDVNDVGTRLGHVWGYELTPVGPSATDVTEFFDCARAPEWLRAAVDNGQRWVESMTVTLERLDAIATGS